MKLRKCLVLCLAFALQVGVTATSSALTVEELLKEMKNYAENKYLNPLAKDLGGALGSGVYHSGKNLGFPGFDVGVRMSLKNTSKDNIVIQSTAIPVIPLALIQAEIGLPKKIDLFVRALPTSDISVLGGGIRYTIFSIGPAGISGMVSYNTANFYQYIEATNYGVNISASVEIPFIKPYIGIGYDINEVKPGSKALQEEPLLAGLKGTHSGTRMEAGINITPFPFVYLYGSYSIVYEDTGYTLGLGIKF
ncbi:MAG: hypothetical protein KJ967_03035 [Elusimicrobia bacterium]|nr:hypothetical protein [Elusimicrobiota bacterium]